MGTVDACARVSGAVRVMPVPPGPWDPTVWMTADSRFAPVSMLTVWPAAKLVVLVTLTLVAPAAAAAASVVLPADTVVLPDVSVVLPPAMVVLPASVVLPTEPPTVRDVPVFTVTVRSRSRSPPTVVSCTPRIRRVPVVDEVHGLGGADRDAGGCREYRRGRRHDQRRCHHDRDEHRQPSPGHRATGVICHCLLLLPHQPTAGEPCSGPPGRISGGHPTSPAWSTLSFRGSLLSKRRPASTGHGCPGICGGPIPRPGVVGTALLELGTKRQRSLATNLHTRQVSEVSNITARCDGAAVDVVRPPTGVTAGASPRGSTGFGPGDPLIRARDGGDVATRRDVRAWVTG